MRLAPRPLSAEGRRREIWMRRRESQRNIEIRSECEQALGLQGPYESGLRYQVWNDQWRERDLHAFFRPSRGCKQLLTSRGSLGTCQTQDFRSWRASEQLGCSAWPFCARAPNQAELQCAVQRQPEGL